MSIAVRNLLASNTVMNAVSQMALPGRTLQKLFGWGIGGRNVQRQSGRFFSYDVFDSVRSLASARVPGQVSSRQTAQRGGAITGVFPRMAETISLLDEDLLNRRLLGAQIDRLDSAGEEYVTKQEAFLAQRFSNAIEFQTAAMLRGSYSYLDDGDDLRHGFAAGDVTIDFRVPAGNRGQLDMLGEGNILDADWSDSATDIPAQLQRVNAALVQLTGMGLSHAVLTSRGWGHVVNNAKVQALGGSANAAFESLKRTSAGEFQAVLRCLPWLTFHVVDYGLQVWNGENEVFTKLIEDDFCAFLPEPSRRWVSYLEGSEIVTEGPGGRKGERYGFYPYAYAVHDPSGWELGAVMNGIPALFTPAAVAYGRIVGGSYGG